MGNRIPYATIVAAKSGDAEAMSKILRHYERYVIVHSMRVLYDEKGYLSVRPLSEAERKTAWEVYTLYHGLWFTRIVYNDDSLDSLVKKGNYEAANRLLKQMLTDMQEADDGRFRG